MKYKTTFTYFLMVCLLVPFFFVTSSLGQTATASIVGTVVDGSGAVVPGVDVTATNVATGISRTAISKDTGIYSITHLSPGAYKISGQLPGFKRVEVAGIVLQVGQEARIDLTLQLGEVTEVVNVIASAPVIETESAKIGDVIEEKAILQLPLNGRNFMELATLTGGINEGGGGSAKTFTQKGQAPSAAGQPLAENAYYLDGAQNIDMYWKSYSIAPSVDAVKEFEIQVGQYSAEYGGGGGAVVNVVTKSGTNDFHGTLFEFHRNDNLDARNFFLRGSKSQLVRNQFGGAVGGPIIRNKTFFFGNYEGSRERRGLTRLATVPTAEQRRGDLSGFGKSIIDPLTGSPLPGNRIPEGRIHPISKSVMEFFPSPNNIGGAQNFLRSPSRLLDHDSILARIDHQLSSAHGLMGRFAFQDVARFTPGVFPLAGGQDFPQLFYNTAVGLTSTVSANLVNEFRFVFNRTENTSKAQNDSVDIGKTLGMPFPAEGPGDRFPVMNLSRTTITNISEDESRLTLISDFHASDSVTWTRGNHVIKVGGSFDRVDDAFSYRGTHTNGSYTFSGQFTGDGFADFLLGIPASVIIPVTPNPRATYTHTAFSGYFVDDWKVSRKLTLNLGVRYEFRSFPREELGRTPMFDRALGGLRYPRQNPQAEPFFTKLRPDLPFGFLDRETAMKSDTNNLAPRFGFAFRPLGGNSTVIRGGYGWFYSSPDINNIINDVTSAPPATLWGTFTSDPKKPTLGYAGPADFQGGVEQFVRVSTFGFPGTPLQDQFLNGYTQQWSLSVGQEITQDLVVQAQYLGSKSTHLESSYDIQQVAPGPGALRTRVPFPKFDRLFGFAFGGNATYHAMILSAEQRFSRGLRFKADYTWGKALASRGARTISSNVGLIQDAFNLKNEVNLSPDDIKHRFTSNYVYELPFGRDFQGLAKGLLSGWQVSGIYTFRTGFALTGPWVGASNCNHSFQNRCYPDRLRDPNLGGNGVDSPAFDSNAFDWPLKRGGPQTVFRLGNSGQNFLRGNNVNLFDLGLLKQTGITEKVDLEFRFECFNCVNHANFGNPNSSPESPFFGRTFSAATARELQFGLKFIW